MKNKEEIQPLLNGNSETKDPDYRALEEGQQYQGQEAKLARIVQQQTNFCPKTTVGLITDSALLLFGAPLAILSLYCMKEYGRIGSEKLFGDTEFNDISGWTTFVLQTLLGMLAFVSITYGVSSGIYKYKQDPSIRNKKNVAKDGFVSVLTATTVVIAAPPAVNSTYKVINPETGYSPLITTVFANGTFYDSLIENGYFGGELIKRSVELTGLFEEKLQQKDMRFIIRRVSTLAREHLPKIAETQAEKLLEFAARFKNGDIDARLAVITDIAQLYEQELGKEEFIKKLFNKQRHVHKEFIAKLIVSAFGMIGVFMTFLKLGISIPKELMDMLQPNIILRYLANVPNAVKGAASGIVNMAQNAVGVFDYLSLIFASSTWRTNKQLNKIFIGIFALSQLGATVNFLAQLGLALSEQLFSNDGWAGWLGNALQAVSTGTGAALLGSYGFIGLVLFISKTIQQFSHRHYLADNITEENLQKIYEELSPHKQEALVDFFLKELSSAMETLENSLVNKGQLAKAITDIFDQKHPTGIDEAQSRGPGETNQEIFVPIPLEEGEEGEGEKKDQATGFYSTLQQKA